MVKDNAIRKKKIDLIKKASALNLVPLLKKHNITRSAFLSYSVNDIKIDQLYNDVLNYIDDISVIIKDIEDEGKKYKTCE